MKRRRDRSWARAPCFLQEDDELAGGRGAVDRAPADALQRSCPAALMARALGNDLRQPAGDDADQARVPLGQPIEIDLNPIEKRGVGDRRDKCSPSWWRPARGARDPQGRVR